MTGAVTWGDLQKLASKAGFTNPPAGEWHMEITKSTYKKTTNGKDMITIVFKVVTPGPQMGATQPHNFVVSPESAGAMGFFFRYMAALGFDSAFFASYASMPPTQVIQLIAPMMVGRQAMVTVGPDRNDAERLVVNNIKRVPANAGVPGVPLSPAQMASGLSVFAPVPGAATGTAVPPAPPIMETPAAPAPAPEPEQAPEDGIEPPDLPF